jgi:hypothetical protein
MIEREPAPRSVRHLPRLLDDLAHQDLRDAKGDNGHLRCSP